MNTIKVVDSKTKKVVDFVNKECVGRVLCPMCGGENIKTGVEDVIGGFNGEIYLTNHCNDCDEKYQIKYAAVSFETNID